jgi:gamma-tubulin complex component 2
MLVFVQQLLYFCTAEVIEPNWQSLMSRLAEKEPRDGAAHPPNGEESNSPGAKPGLTRTVDELMQDHVDFLDTCLKECMLTNSKLLRVLPPYVPSSLGVFSNLDNFPRSTRN